MTTETMALTDQDDALHEPTVDDQWWTETHWFNFDQPGPNLSATIYPFFRKNMNIASLGMFFWDGSACEPWLVKYGRQLWHLPMPEGDLTHLRMAGLEYDCLKPFESWRVAYRDGDVIEAELQYDGLREVHVAHKGPNGGHIDQPCRVRGQIRIRDQRYDLDCLGMRDKTWGGGRTDLTSNRTGAYTFGTLSADDQFLMLSANEGNTGKERAPLSGYLVRDGVKAGLVRSTRRVTERSNGYPVRLELEAEDALGRRFEATGRCVNRHANLALASTFAWLSMAEWQTGDGKAWIGEDQEVWSPDMLGDHLAALNTE